MRSRRWQPDLRPPGAGRRSPAGERDGAVPDPRRAQLARRTSARAAAGSRHPPSPPARPAQPRRPVQRSPSVGVPPLPCRTSGAGSRRGTAATACRWKKPREVARRRVSSGSRLTGTSRMSSASNGSKVGSAEPPQPTHARRSSARPARGGHETAGEAGGSASVLVSVVTAGSSRRRRVITKSRIISSLVP